MGFDLAWNIEVERNKQDTQKIPKDLLFLSVTCLSIELVIYIMLIYHQWAMFLYYIEKKKQRAQLKQSMQSFFESIGPNRETTDIKMVEMKEVKLDRKTRTSIIFVSILLGVNSFNLILDNVF